MSMSHVTGTGMMYTASIAERERRASAFSISTIRTTLMQNGPHIAIIMAGETEGTKLPSAYSTMDKIEGEVVITPNSDIRFDDIVITFEGQVRIWTESYGGSPTMGANRNELLKTFLKMNQPFDESTLPTPRVLLKNVTYRYPFHFVVPNQLLDSQCRHSAHCTDNSVRGSHLQLPPTLGTGKTVSHDGTLQLDDITPDMARIRYCIRAKIGRRGGDTANSATILADEQRHILVTPAHPEVPPVVNDNTYVYSKEKSIRKGLFKGKLGRVVVTATQPAAMQVKTHEKSCRATTIVPVNLKFYSANDSVQPPTLSTLTTKIKFRTHFSTRPILYIPMRKSHLYDGYLGHYEESITLSSRQLNGVKWVKGDIRSANRDSGYDSLDRRDSDNSILSTSTADETDALYYSAQVLVPVEQPKDKAFPPTFHSCYVSRTYELNLQLSVDANAKMSTGVNLKLPVQVTTIGTDAPPAFDATAEPPSFDEFFTPRSIAPPAGVPLLSDLTQDLELRRGPIPPHARLSVGQLPAHMLTNEPNMAPPPGYGARFGYPVEPEMGRIREPLPMGMGVRCG